MLVSKFDDVGLGSGRNQRVLLVERLLELWKVVDIWMDVSFYHAR
jgi:hypothetical protein